MTLPASFSTEVGRHDVEVQPDPGCSWRDRQVTCSCIAANCCLDLSNRRELCFHMVSSLLLAHAVANVFLSLWHEVLVKLALLVNNADTIAFAPRTSPNDDSLLTTSAVTGV